MLAHVYIYIHATCAFLSAKIPVTYCFKTVPVHLSAYIFAVSG